MPKIIYIYYNTIFVRIFKNGVILDKKNLI